MDTLTQIAQRQSGSRCRGSRRIKRTIDALLAAYAAIKIGPHYPLKLTIPRHAQQQSIPHTANRDSASHCHSAVHDNAVRVSAESLNRLMGLSGEAMVGARWLRPYADALLQVKRRQAELITVLDHLWDIIGGPNLNEYATSLFKDAQPQSGRLPADSQ